VVSPQAGLPWPLGATLQGEGVNFALYSAHAEAVELCLYAPDGTSEIGRYRVEHQTDQVWHIFLPGVVAGQRYGYRVYGPYDPPSGSRFNHHKLLIDPYARLWDRPLFWADPMEGHQLGPIDQESTFDPRDNGASMVKGVVAGDDGFDWAEDRLPVIPRSETIIYELHVKGFTQTHPEVPEALRGTFLGLVEPAPLEHLTHLGINSVELLPVMAFLDEPIARLRGLSNYWGYNTLGFFLPDSRYAVRSAPIEFKQMVKRLHEAGIEVILDIVLNHTAEGDHAGPILSFRGIDNQAYYRLRPDGTGVYDNPTGTGNALDFSNPRVVQFAMDCLRYWATEYHIDGFRFDLATILARGRDGAFTPDAGFLTAVQQDPVLQKLKLIAEPWDCCGYHVGGFPPGWSEWNDRSRNDLRRYILRRDIGPAAFADRLAGSSDLFRHDGRGPLASVNFVTAHDGFTLQDLVSYEGKHNEANGEDNRDGDNQGYGWNLGVEGPTDDPAILEGRGRLKRLLLSALLACRGVPMLSMGDELGRTQFGNNNAWCQDSPLSWIDWSTQDREMIDFVCRLVEMRKAEPLLRDANWLDDASVIWLAPGGGRMCGPEWQDPWCRGLGMVLNDGDGRGRFAVLFNARDHSTHFNLEDGFWQVVLSSADEMPFEITGRVELPAFSAVFARNEAP
jgi:glycogen operon protein